MIIPSLNSRCSDKNEIAGKIMGQNAALGHRLRAMDFGPITQEIKTDVVIVGGGVSGLSAARYLAKHTRNFCLLEMDDDLGGNSRGGSNAVSKFPWGAHYLPIPGHSDQELITFLKDCNVITGIKNGLPVYNEYYLCHDPKERLFINNFWQEGIVPHEGVPKKDREEIQRFLDLMYDFKMKTGKDQRPAFSIPVELSSKDEQFILLDSITAEKFLSSHRFSSPYLVWYVNYCCADDFGTSISQTSAWAMIHYFAARNSKASNAASDAVLTWPEGNYWLVNQMRKSIQDQITTNAMVYQVKEEGNGVTCLYYDAMENATKKIIANSVILATPQFINQRILSDTSRGIDYTKFEYAPWMVANLITDHALNERRGEGICWDNVIYGSDSLGYVNASHQDISLHHNKKVLTYYKPLVSDNTVDARRKAHQTSLKEWRELMFKDLQKAHPDLIKHVDEMNVWVWGHGMIKPSTNFIWNENKLHAQQHINNKIFFAHSDLSGISIFEEAFYQGHKAAKALLAS
ncbi:MAG TPA: FAD-dependent oxidoreductase [Ohtaekwangia sp.]|nr:FAD-dependent oxidoreductase [Ohtaekwangia sp.]